MLGVTKGCCCIELELFTRIVGWISIVISIFNTIGWFILGFHWMYIMVYMVMGPFYIAASVYLLKATKQRNPNYAVPWLAITIIGIVVTIVNQTIWLQADPEYVHYDGGHIIVLCAGFIILLYFWFCVYSYYQSLSLVTKNEFGPVLAP